MASKIIVLGGVNGQLEAAFAKLATLHKKNNFTFAIVAGNLFSEDDELVSKLLDGEIEIPLSTYFTVGTTSLPERIIARLEKDADICNNLHFLGKRSTTKTSEGIKIVTLGGQVDPSIIGGLSQDKFLPFHTVGDAKSLHGANTADILLTIGWPASVRKGSKIEIPEGSVEPVGSDHIADLCATIKPRYHFSTSAEFFFEREPFFHNPTVDSPDAKPLTRFISLAAHGNPSKQKSLYAFSLQTSPDPNAPLPSGTTISPFNSRPGGKKRPAQDPDPYSRYANHDRNGHHKRGKGRRGERQPPPGPDQCFFCLSNPNLATHLISSIGEDAYLTAAKGPLTTSATNRNLGLQFPGHALIIPLTHAPTLASITEENEAKEKTFKEMHRFRSALQDMVAARSGNMLGSVTYEISKRSGVHTHWQFLPISASMLRKNLVEAAFRVEAENNAYPPFEARDSGLGENEGDCFRVWIWTPPSDDAPRGTTKHLILPFDDSVRFSLQFGRIALAKLLQLEDRIQWRDCAQSVEEESKENELFKEAFKDFDFTL